MVLPAKVNHGNDLEDLAPDFHKANSQALTSTDSGPFHEPMSNFHWFGESCDPQ